MDRVWFYLKQLIKLPFVYVWQMCGIAWRRPGIFQFIGVFVSVTLLTVWYVARAVLNIAWGLVEALFSVLRFFSNIVLKILTYVVLPLFVGMTVATVKELNSKK